GARDLVPSERDMGRAPDRVVVETHLDAVTLAVDHLIVLDDQVAHRVVDVDAVVEGILEDVVPTDATTPHLVVDLVVVPGEQVPGDRRRTLRRDAGEAVP